MRRTNNGTANTSIGALFRRVRRSSFRLYVFLGRAARTEECFQKNDTSDEKTMKNKTVIQSCSGRKL